MDDTVSETDLDDVASWNFVVENNDESTLSRTLKSMVDWIACVARAIVAKN